MSVSMSPWISDRSYDISLKSPTLWCYSNKYWDQVGFRIRSPLSSFLCLNAPCLGISSWLNLCKSTSSAADRIDWTNWIQKLPFKRPVQHSKPNLNSGYLQLWGFTKIGVVGSMSSTPLISDSPEPSMGWLPCPVLCLNDPDKLAPACPFLIAGNTQKECYKKPFTASSSNQVLRIMSFLACLRVFTPTTLLSAMQEAWLFKEGVWR